jgi:hypothetical protein
VRIKIKATSSEPLSSCHLSRSEIMPFNPKRRTPAQVALHDPEDPFRQVLRTPTAPVDEEEEASSAR